MNSVVTMVLALSLGATVAIAGQNGKGNGPGSETCIATEVGNGNGNGNGNATEVGRAKGRSDRPGHSRRGARFVDEDGDGFNDLAPDADGDGIPNGLDSDYVRPQNGARNSPAHLGRLISTQQGARFFWGRFGLSPLGGAGHAFGPGNGTGSCSNPDPVSGSTGRQGGPPDRGNRR